MRVHERIAETSRRLEALGVANVAPRPDAAVANARTPEEADARKRAASMRHFRLVMAPETWGILVVNGDGASAPDYVGASAFAESALAFAHGKAIYILNGFPGRYGEELRAWGATCLDGDLAKLAADLAPRQPAAPEQSPLF
jgi:hypothetical protein